jgi:hypothetical protein
MNKESTSGLNPGKLARLFGITLRSEGSKDGENSIENMAELIQAHLAGALPLDTAVIDELPILIGRLQRDLSHHAGRTLGDVLTDSESDLEIIKKVRRYAKRMAARKSPSTRHAVAITIYFAAIANALAFHQVKITTHSYESLETSFDNLVNKPWMPAKLIRVFTKARKACQHV